MALHDLTAHRHSTAFAADDARPFWAALPLRSLSAGQGQLAGGTGASTRGVGMVAVDVTQADTISAEAVQHLRSTNPLQIPGPVLTQEFANFSTSCSRRRSTRSSRSSARPSA